MSYINEKRTSSLPIHNMNVQYKSIDFIQYVWKKVFNIEKSKAQIKRDLEQGAIRLNNRKIKVDDVFEIKE